MPMRRNLFLFLWIAFFHNLIPAYVIERLFWQSRGMTVRMVVACEFIYGFIIIALEAPSGVLADLLGRKKLIILGGVLTFLELAILLFAQAFWHFALAVLLAGIGKAAVSGAEHAMLYDTLEELGEANRFERMIGRLRAADHIAVILAAISGSLLADRLGLESAYWVSLISAALSFAGTLALLEPSRRQKAQPKESGWRIFRRATAFFRGRPDALAIILQSMGIAAFIIYVDEFWQLYLAAVGFPVVLFGVASMAMALFRIAGDWLAARLGAAERIGWRMTLLSAAVTLGLFIAGISGSYMGLAAMLLCCCAAEAAQVAGMGYLHQHADSSARATIESLGSLFERVSAIALGILFAWIAESQSLFSAFTALSLCCGAATAVFGLLYRGRCKPVALSLSSHFDEHVSSARRIK